MDAAEVKRALAPHPELFHEFSVHELRLFGSTLRGDAGGASDIDLLVDYTPGAKVGLFAFIRLRRRLSELLGFQVDLVTPDALHPAIREGILREAIRVA
jgi:predicted nucleotidyltransferase